MEENYHQADYDSDYTDEEEEDDDEEDQDPVAELAEHNNTVITALVKLLIQKGVISEQEIDAFVEQVDEEPSEDDEDEDDQDVDDDEPESPSQPQQTPSFQQY